MQATAPQASSSSLHQSDDPTQQKAPPRLSRRQLEARRNIDESYFQSYGEFGIHKEMLSDKVQFVSYLMHCNVALSVCFHQEACLLKSEIAVPAADDHNWAVSN